MQQAKSLVIIGGGAAGFFAAIQAATLSINLEIIILEQGNDVLEKVRISGGGRCNVTHACYEAKELIKYYPRGSKELLSPFYTFNCTHTIEWFEHRNIELKTEADGRIFPVSNSSQTIIDCLTSEANKYGIKIIKQSKVLKVEKSELFRIYYNDKNIEADYVLLASGNNATMWKIMQQLGHSIIAPVPSLFTFTTQHELIKNLEGISFPSIESSLMDSKLKINGAILITHVGLSGPAILKLSAFAARELYAKNYKFTLYINWINYSQEQALHLLKEEKNTQAKKQMSNFSPFDLPHRFWLKVLEINGIKTNKIVADLSKNDIQNIAQTLTKTAFEVISKNTNKDEFVTAGGIDLREVDFKTMQSKIIPNLFFAGETLNIDAVTGGFNFQAAWTTGFIAGNNIAQKNCI
ncbi:MAG TPA: NAD(P)/FAD-dependent oxidoreductase [Chitinophagales bacterium]|jgi:predicted Rossmann fold flavoprotein|nr:NAD(P)/FAD-dependent oxidoreductase [Chitinophagales bacterium]HQW78520.1 NAD(P)/FAD-dependent oxidoreductase [Chitinophagales bacterium]